MRQIRGLVTPRGGFRLEVARQQIRRIGLQQQTFRRDRRQQLAQLQPRRSSHTQPVIPINKPRSTHSCTSLRLPVKQCSTAPGIFSSQGLSSARNRSWASRQCKNTGIDSSAASASWALNAPPAPEAWKNYG
jgi:hypothetical protein